MNKNNITIKSGTYKLETGDNGIKSKSIVTIDNGNLLSDGSSGTKTHFVTTNKGNLIIVIIVEDEVGRESIEKGFDSL